MKSFVCVTDNVINHVSMGLVRQVMKKKSSVLLFVSLHLLLAEYSFSGVCSKMASMQDPFSFAFLFYYGCAVTLLGIYAILWQQILKRMQLTVAFCNKSVTIIWGMVWGRLLFNEPVSVNMMVGAIGVLAGVCLVVNTDE